MIEDPVSGLMNDEARRDIHSFDPLCNQINAVIEQAAVFAIERFTGEPAAFQHFRRAKVAGVHRGHQFAQLIDVEGAGRKVFADGHDQLAVLIRWRSLSEDNWHREVMADKGNNTWEGTFDVTLQGDRVPGISLTQAVAGRKSAAIKRPSAV